MKKYRKLIVYTDKGKYLLDINFNLANYEIVGGILRDKEHHNLGNIIGFEVQDLIPTTIGEMNCYKLDCQNCPLAFCCDKDINLSTTPFSILKNKNLDKKINKFLYKELNKKCSTMRCAKESKRN